MSSTVMRLLAAVLLAPPVIVLHLAPERGITLLSGAWIGAAAMWLWLQSFAAADVEKEQKSWPE